MGVQGLTPFLQKICPGLLKILPNRLQGIQGKKIVIDGTLITQRLHFSQGYGDFPHVLGWYRIAKELDDNGISAICVFDGGTRNGAKAREVKRRRDLRDLAAKRGSIENDRFQRLNKLKSIAERLPIAQESGALREQVLPVAGDQEDEALRTLESLSLDFKANVAKLASVAPPEPLLSSTDEEDAKAYCVLSKAQNQLTTEESKLWGDISSSMSKYVKPSLSEKPSVSSTVPLYFPSSTINDIHALADKSFVMSTSFLRRTHTPTDQTYEESKDILQAMGIPCIHAADATEAEALASAIVHKGLADFVATEDTDVLVYEVPMIKNITSRVEPLVIVSGAEVRAELALDRNAFIDFALLLGTDFSQRITNVGPTRAYKFIKNHGSIERITEVETKYEPKVPLEDYLAEVELGRLVYKTLPTVPMSELKQKIKKKKDDKKVDKVLQRHGLFREMGNINVADCQALLEGNYFGDSPTA